MTKGTKSKVWRRTTIALAVLILVGFGAIVGSLVKLQLIEGEQLKSEAVSNQLKDTTITAQRGTIYDVNMKTLAQSATVWKIVVVPAQLKSYKNQEQKQAVKEATADCLAQTLGLKKEDVIKAIEDNPNSYWQVMATKVETDVRDKILAYEKNFQEQQKAKGTNLSISSMIDMVADYKRYYPYGDFASQVLGFTNTDGVGAEGLEAEYNSVLAGVNGRVVSAKSATQQDMPFQYQQEVPAQDGDSLVLTIDEVVQHTLEKYLEEGAELNKVGNRASAIMMNVKTGEILGMATKGGFDADDPIAESVAEEGSFDPNDPRKLTDSEKARIAKLPEDQQAQATSNALQQKWRNKPVSDTYYPGSVFKMVTASMALEEGIVNDNTQFNCPGYFSPSKNASPIHCWKTAGHGAETFHDGLVNSCNVVFMQVGLKIGPQTFFKYFESFGFTQPTGIDMSGEAQHYQYYTAAQLNPVELATEAFGQNFSITPIQMITAAATIANGGNLVQPHVVKQILDPNGNVVKSISTETKRQVISESTAKDVIGLMEDDAKAGTAKNGYVAGYRIAGKTGTSEKIEKDNKYKSYMREHGNSGEAHNYYIASYCGVAPADDPQYALLVFCDEPNGNSYYGNSVAGPIFNKIMTDVLPYLGVEPVYTEEEQTKLDVKAPDVVGKSVQDAKSAISGQDGQLTAKVYGDGDTVLTQLPASGTNVPRGGQVVLFTTAESQQEKTKVPDFVGDGTNSISTVESMAADADVNISITGATNSSSNAVVASMQSIAANTEVQPGTVITVTIAEQGASG